MNEEQDLCAETASEENHNPNTPMPMGIGISVGGHHSVQIQRAENGFIVTVGCKTFISKDWLEVSSKLQDYWKNPRKAEKELYK